MNAEKTTKNGYQLKSCVCLLNFDMEKIACFFLIERKILERVPKKFPMKIFVFRAGITMSLLKLNLGENILNLSIVI